MGVGCPGGLAAPGVLKTLVWWGGQVVGIKESLAPLARDEMPVSLPRLWPSSHFLCL